MPPIGQAAGSAELQLDQLTRTVAAVSTTTLEFKIQALRNNRPADPIQRMQSEAIVELYAVVKQIQQALAPVGPPLPNVQAVRDAAAAAAATKMAAAKTSVGLQGGVRRR